MLRERLLLAVPAARRLFKAEGPVRLKAVSGESFIIPPRDIGPGLYDLIISHCHSFGFAPRITQHARQMQTVVGLVSSGMGVALVPSSVRNLKRTGVQYRPLRGKAAMVEIGILRRRDVDSAVRDHFTEVLRNNLTLQGYADHRR